MSIKSITVCDSCGKEIKGRLIVHTCPCCHQDVCVACQLEEDAKHEQRDREAKQSQKLEELQEPEKASRSPAESSIPVVKPGMKLDVTKKVGKPIEESQDKPKDTHPLADFEVKTPEPGTNAKRIVRFGTATSDNPQLREAVKEVLIEVFGLKNTVSPGKEPDVYDFISKMPDHPNRTLILGILKPTPAGTGR